MRFIWALTALAASLPWAEARERWRETLARVDIDSKTDDDYTPNNFQMFPSGSNVTNLTAQYFPEHNSKRARVTYGPFDVPPMQDYNGMIDYIQVGAKMPCADCTITWMQASLQYPNGTYANANTSLWLHHIVLIDHAGTDTVCGSNFYGQGQRWFASGNERTRGDISRGGTVPMGYYIGLDDIQIMACELMNQAMDNQTAVPVIEYEYIEGFPDGFYKANPIWMDIGGCATSDMPPKTNDTFSYTSPAYKVNFTGAIIAEGAHLHDGGTTLEIQKNNQSECLCTAYYGQTAGYWDAPGTMYIMNTDGDGDSDSDSDGPFAEEEENMDSMDHISTISGCYSPSSMLVPGDEISIIANYDLIKHMPMLNTDGTLADIMGISIIYAAENMSEEAMMKYSSTPAPAQIRPVLIDPAMVMDGDGDSPATMSMPMICSDSDSPGNLSTVGLDMSSPLIQAAYLMAILDDACLQLWSSAYSRYFWYGIGAVIAVFTVKRLARLAQLTMRKRAAAAKRTHRNSGIVRQVAGTLRSISYRQYGPTSRAQLVKVPPVGTVAMLAGYLAFILCLVFIRSSTGDDQSYQSIGVRAAWVTVAQLPLVVILAGKRNFVDFFTAVGYERLNVLHRWVARGLFLTATFHFGFQNEGWRRLGLMHLEWTTDSCPPTGVAAYAILIWMNISTLPPFRSMSYEFFVAQHIITFFGLIIAIMLHIPATALFARTYVFTAIAFYLFSRMVQTLFYFYRNVRPGSASLARLSSSVVQVRVRGSRVRSWTPGSFVLLGMPKYGLFQSHPATIASTPTSHGGDLIFVLRARRGFTEKLLHGANDDTERVALIDGPYGGKQDDLAAYSTAVLIAGSTGISFVLPILADMAERAAMKNLPVRRVVVVWSTKDREQVEALITEVDHTLRNLRGHGVDTDLHVHVTGSMDRIEKRTSDASSEEHSDSAVKEAAVNAIARPTGSRNDSDTSLEAAMNKVVSGRPELSAVLRAAGVETEGGEMGVAVCGPLSMSKDVRNTAAGMRGVYLHVEGFSW